MEFLLPRFSAPDHCRAIETTVASRILQKVTGCYARANR